MFRYPNDYNKRGIYENLRGDASPMEGPEGQGERKATPQPVLAAHARLQVPPSLGWGHSRETPEGAEAKPWYEPIYLGGVFQLEKGDRLSAEINLPAYLDFAESGDRKSVV